MEKKIFKVAIFGHTSNEQKTLGSIFKLATARIRQYTLLNSTERETANIILVDIDDSNARSEWKSFNVHHNNIPAIKVSSKTIPDNNITNEVYLRRPLTLKRVLDILDQVTIKELKFVPELSIADDTMVGEDDIDILEEAGKVAKNTNKTGIKALVVDDAFAVRKHMKIQLQLYGMDIDFAETGEAALDYIQEKVYNIIFLDVMLPGIDGLKVCKQIKAHKLSQNTPVIMLTGKDGGLDKIRGKMAGANEYLTKPVQQDGLETVFKQYLPNILIGN